MRQPNEVSFPNGLNALSDADLDHVTGGGVSSHVPPNASAPSRGSGPAGTNTGGGVDVPSVSTVLEVAGSIASIIGLFI